MKTLLTAIFMLAATVPSFAAKCPSWPDLREKSKESGFKIVQLNGEDFDNFIFNYNFDKVSEENGNSDLAETVVAKQIYVGFLPDGGDTLNVVFVDGDCITTSDNVYSMKPKRFLNLLTTRDRNHV